MRKMSSVLLVILIITLLLSSCTVFFPAKEKVVTLTNEKAAEILKDKTENEIHNHWGNPDDYLSGFYGDVYIFNGKQITVYYNADGTVTDVLVFDKQAGF